MRKEASFVEKMYAETGLMFPYFQNLSSDVQQFDDFFHSHKFITSLDNLTQTLSVSDYDIGGEGDLFKAPEPIIQQSLITLDPITSNLQMISCVEDAISPQQLKVTDIELFQEEEFLNDVFYECENLLAKEAAVESSPLFEVINFSFPVKTDENLVAKENVDQSPRRMSSDSPNSMDPIQGAQVKSNFLNFNEIDFGMRRAFSEGDIETLSDVNTSFNYHPHVITEDRLQKLTRYRNKKTKRNFGRKIKYACRKALADTQPRIRGRFAKTDTS